MRIKGDSSPAPWCHTSASVAQLTVTTCLAGLAVGQLVAGPMSDVLGRRKPLLTGLVIYAAASLLCAVAPNVATLICFRGVEGIGGACAVVVAYACVRDQYSGNAAARYFSLLLLVTGLAPVLAPLIGAQLLKLWDWQGIFIALAAVSSAVFVACIARLPETLPAHQRQASSLRQAGLHYRHVLADRHFAGYVLINAFAFAAMFAYISGSPFVLENVYGISPQRYSLVFAVNAVGLVTAAQVSGRLVLRLGARPLLGVGVNGIAAGAAGLVAVTAAGLGMWLTLSAFFIVVTSAGLVLPNAATLALDDHGSRAGSAAALLGFGQFLAGGLAAPLVGVLGPYSALPAAIVMAMLGTAAVTVLVTMTRTVTGRERQRRAPGDVPPA